MKKSEARSDDQSSQVNSSLGGIKGSVPVNVRSTDKPLSSIKGGKKSPQSPTSPTRTRQKGIGVQRDLPSPRQTPLKNNTKKKSEPPSPTLTNKKPVVYKSIKMQEFTFQQGVGGQQIRVVENLANSFRGKQSSTCSSPRRDTYTFNIANSNNTQGVIAVIDDQ